MEGNARLTNEQLAEIRKRAEKLSKGNIFRDMSALAINNKVVFEDVPKLLAEIERLRKLAHELNESLKNAGETVIFEFSGDIDGQLAKNEKVYEKFKNEINGVDKDGSDI